MRDEIWDSERHTEESRTDAFGTIRFTAQSENAPATKVCIQIVYSGIHLQQYVRHPWLGAEFSLFSSVHFINFRFSYQNKIDKSVVHSNISILLTVGSTEVIFIIYLLFPVHSDWLRENHVSFSKQRKGSGFLDIFRARNWSFENSSNRMRVLWKRKAKRRNFCSELEQMSISTCRCMLSTTQKLWIRCNLL